MTTELLLGQIEVVNNKIDTESDDAIMALYKFIFKTTTEDGVSARERIKNFKGFPFGTDTQDYINELQNARQLTISDYLNCAEILNLRNNIDDTIIYIYKQLTEHHKKICKSLDQCEEWIPELDKVSDDAVKSLFKFIFYTEDSEDTKDSGNTGVSNRKRRITEFDGFPDMMNITEYEYMFEKLRKLTLNDLINCCESLSINYKINKLVKQLCDCLVDMNTLLRIQLKETKSQNSSISYLKAILRGIPLAKEYILYNIVALNSTMSRIDTKYYQNIKPKN